MTSPGPGDGDIHSDEERAAELVRSHHKPARSSHATISAGSSGTEPNVRLQRLSDALDKFLDLIDHQAT